MKNILIPCLQMYEKKMRKPICSIMKCRFIGYVVLISQGIY